MKNNNTSPLKNNNTSPLLVPVSIYSVSLLVGLLLGLFLVRPEIGEKVLDLYSIAGNNFFVIFSRNAIIILFIYISCVFTKIYAYFTYGINGIILGVYLGWIIISNINLLWLIIPHGIFEIPCIICTGYIVHKSESFIRENFNCYIKMLLLHELAILCCALVESFITPFFMKYI